MVIYNHNFYPRPPRGGRPVHSPSLGSVAVFLSTPSARRATRGRVQGAQCKAISIHALREEGDRNAVQLILEGRSISIHALREEGDYAAVTAYHRGGIFLSTPSARRATREERAGLTYGAYFYPRPPRGGRHHGGNPGLLFDAISIHALREEGDRPRASCSGRAYYFYPRPPRGGRLLTPRSKAPHNNFYPRPPRGGRPEVCGADRRVCEISIHALREEGDGILLSDAIEY